MRFLFSLLLATASAFSLGDIKHFLVIFFENRSFNHIFGCAAAKGLLPGVDGLLRELERLGQSAFEHTVAARDGLVIDI